MGKLVTKTTLSYYITWFWIILAILSCLCISLSLIGIILGSVSLDRTQDLEEDKQSKEPFETWLTVNGTLYKNSITDNIILLENVPIKYSRIDKIVSVRLPLLVVEDTLIGTLSYLILHIKNEDRIPFIVGDVQEWGQSNTVSLTTTEFIVNYPDSRIGVIKASELGSIGQMFIYNFIIGYSPVPENSTIDIDGGLCQYETSLDSSASMLSSFTTNQLINGALRGKLIK